MSPRHSRDPRCPRCAFRGDPCLCPEVPQVETQLGILIVRHAAEIKKQSNSARWAALALDCTVIDYAATSAPFDAAALGDLHDAWLLFPGGDATPPPAAPPRRLIVPDGTWQQAKRIAARVPELRRLPHLCIGEVPQERRLRRAPENVNGMSTLEAIACALELCGEPLPAAQLRDLHRAVMARVERARGWLPPP
jgi:DTW domain-containing protein YfiP